MRIISGTYRGRRLVAPKGTATRPTGDRTRETLFNMLASRLGSFEGLNIADLFAGSGALGIEAISRGAANCLFVEQEPQALAALRQNIENLDLRDTARITQGSVMHLGPVSSPYGLIVLDPPYGTGAGCVALDRLLRLGWIGGETWIALETGAKEDVAIKGLSIMAERKVGKARLTLLTKNAG